MATASTDRTTRLWDFMLPPDPAVQRLCDAAGREFTALEWATFLPGGKYEATCGQV